mmetsp:Transcript_63329/g.151035  ORF Transcript_63329/g.151035 Transcript_63329/m.151035 type:complete len:236 (+) Transcript_63329:385-1092(+)
MRGVPDDRGDHRAPPPLDRPRAGAHALGAQAGRRVDGAGAAVHAPGVHVRRAEADSSAADARDRGALRRHGAQLPRVAPVGPLHGSEDVRGGVGPDRSGRGDDFRRPGRANPAHHGRLLHVLGQPDLPSVLPGGAVDDPYDHPQGVIGGDRGVQGEARGEHPAQLRAREPPPHQVARRGAGPLDVPWAAGGGLVGQLSGAPIVRDDGPVRVTPEPGTARPLPRGPTAPVTHRHLH